ncbi:ABC transporter ATP-binding protein [Sporichthya polymorpha]|uniref:ABC transporter ATP-binding protein n=1 Tax=Sporichthya polymorpha TaxID=35751 RepID=UPI0003A9070C|nr:ABC transporter ATP-binding protein [Sporichthya polymorpha]
MLELTDVRAGYGGVTVLRDLSLWVPRGSVVALLGPNGAGKTTTLRVASGLLRPSSGRITVDGRPFPRGADAVSRAGVCHVPEGRGVFPSLTVRENLLVQARGKNVGDGIEKATAAFPRLGQRLSQLAGTMSGGEQQMLALAKSYVSSPAYVLLDEVSMGLAPKVVDEIFEFLRRLASEGVALLLVEQYVTRALEIADYVFLLNHGRVAFRGEPGELDSSAIFAEYMGVGA